VIILSDGTYASLLVLFLYIFGKIDLSKIDDDVVCLSFADNMARFDNVSIDEFKSAQQTEMLCTKYIILFSLVKSFSIVLSYEMKCSRCWLGNYSSPDNTIEKQFPRRRQ